MPWTLDGYRSFEYLGTVESGTEIHYRGGQIVRIEAYQYAQMRRHFLHQVIWVSGSFNSALLANSLGSWMIENVTDKRVAAFVASILVLEGYANRVGVRKIQIYK